MWYENPHAAGSIDAVELDGEILCRRGEEDGLAWIKRAGVWAAEIHAKHAMKLPGQR